MKKLILLPVALVSGLTAQADTNLAAGWDFNDATGSTTANSYAANLGSQQNSAALYVDGSFGSSNLIEPSGPPNFNTGERSIAGTGFTQGLNFVFTDNTDGFTAFSTTNNKEFQLFGNKATTSLNGKSVVFAFNTIGLADISISTAAERASQGPTLNTWAWSVNGTDYTNIGGTWDPATTASVFTLDLTAVNALENQASVYVRLTMNGQTGTSGATNYLKFDNLQIGGTVVPEPSTWAVVAGVSVMGAVLLRRRRTAKV